MREELPFPEPEETRALLRDVLAFIDAYEGESAVGSLRSTCTSDSSNSVDLNSVSRGRGKKRWAKDHPGYYQRRREDMKAEREALRDQISQYEAQLELLRVQKPRKEDFVSKWGWIDAVTREETKRRKAE